MTNAGPGAGGGGPFLRSLLEVLYDGQPGAARDVATAAARIKAQAASRHERLIFPGDPAVLAKLARHYRDPEGGQISSGSQGGQQCVKSGIDKERSSTHAHTDGMVWVSSCSPANYLDAVLVGR